MTNQAAQTMPELRELALRAAPFLRDEGSNYEDDGNNEPLELARAIEASLAGNPNRDAANPGGCECEKCGRVFIGAEWHVLCGICVDHGVAQPDGSGLRNGDNVSASTPEASPQPQVTNPAYTACNVEGTWLWGKLMDWCRAHRTSPASFDSLFAIAREAHQANQQAGQNRPINNDLDEKSTSEQAALSQTAGVADGFVLIDKGAVKLVENVLRRNGKDEVADEMLSAIGNAMLAAAPAASGAHPDALPDGTLSKSTAKRVTALAAASVSERALAMVDEVIEAAFGLESAEASRCPGENTDVQKDRLSRARSAIEQALTQQRGEPFAWAMTDHQADGPMTILTTNREDAKFWGEQGIDVEPLYKAPQPSADAVRELVKRWRDEANAGYLTGKESIDCATTNRQNVFFQCADELESLLSGGSNA